MHKDLDVELRAATTPAGEPTDEYRHIGAADDLEGG
jgi:hypothetical protein